MSSLQLSQRTLHRQASVVSELLGMCLTVTRHLTKSYALAREKHLA